MKRLLVVIQAWAKHFLYELAHFFLLATFEVGIDNIILYMRDLRLVKVPGLLSEPIFTFKSALSLSGICFASKF